MTDTVEGWADTKSGEEKGVCISDSPKWKWVAADPSKAKAIQNGGTNIFKGSSLDVTKSNLDDHCNSQAMEKPPKTDGWPAGLTCTKKKVLDEKGCKDKTKGGCKEGCEWKSCELPILPSPGNDTSFTIEQSDLDRINKYCLAPNNGIPSQCNKEHKFSAASHGSCSGRAFFTKDKAGKHVLHSATNTIGAEWLTLTGGHAPCMSDNFTKAVDKIANTLTDDKRKLYEGGTAAITISAKRPATNSSDSYRGMKIVCNNQDTGVIKCGPAGAQYGGMVNRHQELNAVSDITGCHCGDTQADGHNTDVRCGPDDMNLSAPMIDAVGHVTTKAMDSKCGPVQSAADAVAAAAQVFKHKLSLQTTNVLAGIAGLGPAPLKPMSAEPNWSGAPLHSGGGKTNPFRQVDAELAKKADVTNCEDLSDGSTCTGSKQVRNGTVMGRCTWDDNRAQSCMLES